MTSPIAPRFLVLMATLCLLASAQDDDPEVSSFLERVAPGDHEEAAAPGDAIEPGWDLPAEGALLWRFVGEVDAEMLGRRFEQKMEALLGVQAGEGGRPELVFVPSMGEGRWGPAGPPVPIEGDDRPAGVRLQTDTLFPLPAGGLRQGRPVAIPLTLPVNAQGLLLEATGEQRVELTRFVRVDDVLCAEIATEIDIASIELPEDHEATVFVRGRGIYLYDIERSTFRSARIATLLRAEVTSTVGGQRTELLRMKSDQYQAYDFEGVGPIPDPAEAPPRPIRPEPGEPSVVRDTAPAGRWADFAAQRVGDFVVHTEKGKGLQVRHEVLSIDADSKTITFESSTVLPDGSAQRMLFEVRCVDDENPLWITLAEGDETIEVGGRRYECHWLEQNQGGGDEPRKVWFSPEVPRVGWHGHTEHGGIVRIDDGFNDVELFDSGRGDE